MIYFFAFLTLSIAFTMIAHSIDPCSLKIWRLNDVVGNQKLCERFGSEINIHTRFHLLLHTAPIVIVLLVYHLGFRRFFRSILHAERRENR
jgi:hypothetical protein